MQWLADKGEHVQSRYAADLKELWVEVLLAVVASHVCKGKWRQVPLIGSSLQLCEDMQGCRDLACAC